jgi:hypothetical protein
VPDFYRKAADAKMFASLQDLESHFIDFLGGRDKNEKVATIAEKLLSDAEFQALLSVPTKGRKMSGTLHVAVNVFSLIS